MLGCVIKQISRFWEVWIPQGRFSVCKGKLSVSRKISRWLQKEHSTDVRLTQRTIVPSKKLPIQDGSAVAKSLACLAGHLVWSDINPLPRAWWHYKWDHWVTGRTTWIYGVYLSWSGGGAQREKERNNQKIQKERKNLERKGRRKRELKMRKKNIVANKQREEFEKKTGIQWRKRIIKEVIERK